MSSVRPTLVLPRYSLAVRAAPIMEVERPTDERPGAVIVLVGGCRYKVPVGPAFWARGDPPPGAWLVERRNGGHGWYGQAAFEASAVRVQTEAA